MEAGSPSAHKKRKRHLTASQHPPPLAALPQTQHSHILILYTLTEQELVQLFPSHLQRPRDRESSNRPPNEGHSQLITPITVHTHNGQLSGPPGLWQDPRRMAVKPQHRVQASARLQTHQHHLHHWYVPNSPQVQTDEQDAYLFPRQAPRPTPRRR